VSDLDAPQGSTPRSLDLSGPQPLVLNSGPALWVVESGSVALFRVDLAQGEPAGQRKLLRRVGAGQPLVSRSVSRGEESALIVMPVQRALLREQAFAERWSDVRARAEVLAPLLEEWIAHLALSIPQGRPLERPERPTEPGLLELEDGQDLTAGRRHVIWVRVLEGQLEVAGVEGALLLPCAAPLPVGPGLVLRASGPCNVAIERTDAIESLADVLAGLDCLEGLTLALLKAQDEREHAAELERLERSARMQERRLANAFDEVAAVLHPLPIATSDSDPLLAAARTIGRALGVQVRAPGRSAESGAADPVEAIARASQLRTRDVRLSGNWWRRDCGYLLAVQRTGADVRPIALLPEQGGYTAYDPTSGSARRVDGPFAASLAPDATAFNRPLPSGSLGLSHLARFALRGRRRDLSLALGVGIAATLLSMLVPIGTAWIMDRAIPGADLTLLWEIGLGLSAVVLGQVLYRVSQGMVLLRLGVISEVETQSALWDRLLRLRPSFFRQFTSGDLQSRVMAVADVGRDITGNVLTTLFSAFLSLLNLGLLIYYSPKLALLAVGVALAVAVATFSFGFALRRFLQRLLELEGRFFGLEVQLIQGVGKLRVAGAEARAFAHWLTAYGRQLALMARALAIGDAARVFNVLVGPLSTVLLFGSALAMLHPGTAAGGGAALTLGSFLAFSAAFGAFLGGATSLSDMVVEFLDTTAKARRIEPILKEAPEVDESKADPGPLGGQVALEGVRFRYRADGPEVLSGVDFSAEPGEFVALIGPSGGGKSTLLRLLLGFEAPSAGKVLYDGQDLATLDVLAVRRQLGVVLQNGRVSAGSIFENIGGGSLISLDEAWAAAEDAGFADDVREMGMGLHTIVSEGGTNLSGGQRQRLLIARALATRPRLLFFDEATSALDNRTQAIVARSLERLRVTRVVIAHRLSTIRRADRIYVLDGGRMVEQGSFAELVQNEHLFARMMARQMA
jgi:NHLM bacteriocin system ABC transporter ATP-binding protein